MEKSDNIYTMQAMVDVMTVCLLEEVERVAILGREAPESERALSGILRRAAIGRLSPSLRDRVKCKEFRALAHELISEAGFRAWEQCKKKGKGKKF